MKRPDVCIAGAGVIGLTLALALVRRHLSVCVLTAGDAMDEASTAAAGMLAVDDPDNPSALQPLSRFSRDLYPELLDRLHVPGAPLVSFQTHRTLQAIPDHLAATHPLASSIQSFLPAASSSPSRFLSLIEQSLDPRELAPALLAAVLAARIDLRPHTRVLSVAEHQSSVYVRTSIGDLEAEQFVDCTGAWSLSSALRPSLRITPRKGQMLTVTTPPSLMPGTVLRSHSIYMVPRLHGPSAGRTVIGATVEDVGFDRSIDPHQLTTLLEHAAQLLPELRNTAILSSWSGLRPATEDLLPVLGRLPGSDRLLIASGHYRNGILLAPGTAELLARQLCREPLSLSLAAFAPDRFQPRQAPPST